MGPPTTEPGGREERPNGRGGQIQVVPEHELVIGDDASAELSRGSSSAQRRALRVPHVK
jgi:hypothetical protein